MRVGQELLPISPGGVFMGLTRFCAFVVAAAALPITAHAQDTTVDPGRVDERLREAPPLPDARDAAVPELPAQQLPPEAAVQVRLTEVRFEGVTVVPIDALQALAAPYLNRDMPVASVFSLAEEVTAEYRRRGFVLSRALVGAQRIEDGVLTIQMVEGYIGTTRIEGDAGGYRPFLEGYLAPVAAGRPTDGDALTRALLLARDLRGVDVRAVVTPSETQAGAADLSLVVERRPIEGFFAIDNRGSRWLGPLQIYGGFSFNDGLGLGERISITGVAAPANRELGFLSASYDQPIGNSGLRVTAFGSYAETRPGDELRRLGLTGESLTFGGGLSYPIIRSRSANLIGRLTFTGRDAESSNDFVAPIFRDKVRTLEAELVGNHAITPGGLFSVQLSATRGLDLFGATLGGDRQKSRATASGEFWRFNFELNLMQQVAGGFYVSLGAKGQVTDDSLLASEEFGIGGTEYGRAYDPSEITGDTGIAGRAEVFYAAPVGQGTTIQPFAYYEGGRVQQNRPLPGEIVRTSLDALGFGIRGSSADGVAASIEFAKPMSRDVAAEGNRDGRVFFSLSARF